MIKCSYCDFSGFYKNGHSHNGSQQYFCKSCRMTFSLHFFDKPQLLFPLYPNQQHPRFITTDGLAVYKQTVEELFGSGVHQRAKLGHNNVVESRYSLLKDLIRAKRGLKTFSNVSKYINSRVYIHNFYKDLVNDNYAIIQFLIATIMQS